MCFFNTASDRSLKSSIEVQQKFKQVEAGTTISLGAPLNTEQMWHLKLANINNLSNDDYRISVYLYFSISFYKLDKTTEGRLSKETLKQSPEPHKDC